MEHEPLHYLDSKCKLDHPDFDEDAMHRCPGCGDPVYNARIRAMKGDMRCIKCTDTKPYMGAMNYDHKTAGILEVTQDRKVFKYLKKPINQKR